MLNEEKMGKGKEDEKQKGKMELTGSNEGNGGWVRTERDGRKQMRGK